MPNERNESIMKKKTIALLCAFSLLSMSGCGEQRNTPLAPSDSTETSATAKADTREETGENPSESIEPAALTDETTSALAQNETPEQSVAETETVTQTSAPAPKPKESEPTEPVSTEEIPVTETVFPPLTERDIEMTIEEKTITFDTESLTLRYRYVGGAAYAEYGFGCEYTLEKKETDGSWQTIPFSENAAFNALGYLIGTESPNQATSVSLRGDFYAEPLTPGEYRVVKPIGNITLTAEFRILAPCGGVLYEIESEKGELTLQIEEIRSDGFWCAHPWPYPAHYFVECDPTAYADYCVGDNIEVEYAPMYKTGEWEYRLLPTAIRPSDYYLEPGMDAKPVIYLYPEKETEVDVRLDYDGRLTVTYPEYRNGWRVTAQPDGTLTDADGNEYSYLFWEGVSDEAYDFREGFCVQGCDTAEFLREKLSLLGLTPREYNEFIVYWLPKMQGNPYNVISFQGEAYTDRAALSVSPAPDTTLRVFMTYYPSETAVELPAQELTPTERIGFTLVEWGGAECPKP